MSKDLTHRNILMEKIRNLPHKPGVYMMKDRLAKVIYVGKAKNLRKRVTSYFQNEKKLVWQQPKIGALVQLIYDVDFLQVRNEEEALLLEQKLIKQYQPKYNTLLLDDKRFPMIKVDIQSTFPKFRICRLRIDEKSRYFGPFVHSRFVHKALQEIKKKFGVLLDDAPEPKLIPDSNSTYKIYDDIRSEIFGHPNEVTQDSYRQRVDEACLCLEGKEKEWVIELEQKMKEYSSLQQFEKAAEMRDILEAIKKTVHPKKLFQKDILSKKPVDNIALEQLKSILGMQQYPNLVECFDISHISGTFVVAAMVCFKNGLPDKTNYRRFKIRSFVGNDDFRAMEEVVDRRYRRLVIEKKPLPDLVVIDGGKGQVSAAMKVFQALNISSTFLVGLAKKEEILILPYNQGEIHLEKNNLALQFVQRIRDEAHRFANTFNSELRTKKIRESILDEMKGLGQKRKQLILSHFKNISALRSASIQDISNVDGIGPLMAQKIKDFLHHH